MSSSYQRNPINMSSHPSKIPTYSREQFAYDEISKYFATIIIDEANAKGNKWIRCSVPLISLFRSEKERELFLKYTKDSTDPYTITLRKILSDPVALKNCFLNIVEKIGDTYRKNNLTEFKTTTFKFSADNYSKGGEKVRYRLDTTGKEVKEDGLVDLTGTYKAIKEYRAKKAEKEDKKDQSQKRA